jgi:MOSC domain-containing protein YiiM
VKARPKKLVGALVSVHTGSKADYNTGDGEDYSKASRPSVQVELDGFVGDRHRGFERIAAAYDPDPTGTVRRNERQWSGVSLEELAVIRERLDLKEPLMAATLGANICVEGIPDFSRLARGSRLVFPSGAVLVIEECNPPCADIAVQVAAAHTTNSGEPVTGKMFPKYAVGLRGVVGVVDVAGTIEAGDRVVVEVNERRE